MIETLPMGFRVGDRYQLRQLLGEGGFACVYEALDVTLDRRVAVKLLKDHPDPQRREDARTRFFREAKFAAQIDHPDVVTIFDVGLVDDAPYIVLELLSGHSLAQELWLHGPMEPERARRLFARVLHAMATAHEQGVIHRDLKPSNLVVSHRGEPVESLRVLDFGIAFYLGASLTRLTGTGQFLGTPEYVSPEYIREQQVTPALDVYQLGLVFVEMLVGKPLVGLTHPLQCLFAHCNGHVKVPDYLAASPVGPILARALAPQVHERYQNAGAFLEDFARLGPGDVPALPTDASPEAIVVTQEWTSEEIEQWSVSVPNLLAEGSRPLAVVTDEAQTFAPVDGWAQIAPSPAAPAEATVGADPTKRAAVVAVALTLIAAAATAMVAMGGGAPAADRGTEAGADVPVAVAEPPAAPELEPEVAVVVAPDAAAEDAGVSEDEDEALEARAILVQTRPPGAELLEDGVILGLAPLEVTLPPNARRTLSARLDGHAPRTVVLGEQTQADVVISLSAEEPARPARQRGSRPAKPAPASRSAPVSAQPSRSQPPPMAPFD